VQNIWSASTAKRQAPDPKAHRLLHSCLGPFLIGYESIFAAGYQIFYKGSNLTEANHI